MARPTEAELDMFRRVAVQQPQFYEYCIKQRDSHRASLEQVDSEILRGQAQLYSEFIKYLKPPPTR